ncbi:MAG: tRNA 2-thiouridine(34) synthase MnmA [Bacteroidales bacterium]|jgi:tRNA-specific 2-thiouridylase|nr:tRNA 2-thiouridine(34) synthase MnmA [Bacteroidales bacterium]MDY0368800.1 tRNA 2-thiouridine(34) synthase MnmA [Bacteroidales bacterium]
MEIAALVSGGVDSSVTIPLLKEQGYDPVIFYIKIGMEDKSGFIDCPSEEDIEITSYIAHKYDCHLVIVDLHKEYWETVVAYTMDAIQKGLTPNPDVMCNRLIKFGVFEERFGYQFDKISTGHYAQVIENDQGFFLGTAADPVKDQTYFLARITYAQLSKLMFPVGSLQKAEVRLLAEKMRLPSAHRPDSQGICFLGKVNYNDFIRQYAGERQGKIIEMETGKILGTHKGYWFHTIGQRKGLGLSGGPWFVVEKNVEENLLFVSNGYDPITQYKDTISLTDMHWLHPEFKPEEDMPVRFKIRHQPEFNQGVIRSEKEGLRIHSHQPIAGIAPGQFGVLYHATKPYCLGSGVISQQQIA